MGDLTITKENVKLVRGANEHMHTAPAGEAFNAGQYIRFDGASGKFVKGNATADAEIGDGFISLRTAAIGDPVTGVKGPCVLEVGAALAGLSFGDAVYVSDTDATLADAHGTVTKIAGHVVPGWGSTTPEKLLRVDL